MQKEGVNAGVYYNDFLMVLSIHFTSFDVFKVGKFIKGIND